MLSRFSKLIGAGLGLLTPSGLVAIATAYGLDLTAAQSTALLSVVALVGTLVGVYVAPANTSKPAANEVDAPSQAVREEAALPEFGDAVDPAIV